MQDDQVSRSIRIRAGEDVFTRSEDPDRWYRIVAGWIQLRQVISDSREVAIMLLGPDQLITPAPPGGELILEALVDTELSRIDAREGSVMREMVKAQSRLITAQHRLVTDILSRDRRVRVVTVLLELAAALGINRDDGMTEIDLRLTDERLGQITALDRSTVTSVLLALRADGMVSKRGPGRIAVQRALLQQWLNDRRRPAPSP